MWKLVDWENARTEQKPYGKIKYVRAVCNCGDEKWYRASRIRTGRINNCFSCGHKRGGEKNLKHGHNRKKKTSKTYYIWGDMVGRCTNHKHRSFRYYGGRGIAVCDRWRDFSKFLEDMGESNGLSIERIDVNKNYDPSNCKWIDKREQAKNTTRTRVAKIEGITDTVLGHCKRLNLSRHIVDKRIALGWSVEDAILVEGNKKKSLS